MPWQQQVANVGGELLPDGRPAYREVVFTVPRQSGKTTLILGWEVHRALGWSQLLGERQRIVYSAQTGKDAREKLVEDQHPLLEPKKKLLRIKTLRIATGSEGVLWQNGSRLGLMGGTDSSGHGKTVDLAVKDELFKDVDFHRDQTLKPAMVTRSHAQILTASTMGTLDSVALNTAVEKGRAAVDAGKTSGTAYFEWSAGPDDDPADPATWWRCMPALGRTITLEIVEHEYETMTLGDFRRAFTNVLTATEERVIPKSVWDRICSPDVEATAQMFAVDVNPERTMAAIVAVGNGPIVELIDYRLGTHWVVERCRELQQKYGAKFALSKTGPVGSFIEEFIRERIHVVELTATDMIRGSEYFYDQTLEGAFQVRRSPELDAAVAGAVKRTVSDAWVWDRKGSGPDITPLVAASAGLWAFANRARSQFVSLADALAAAEQETA